MHFRHSDASKKKRLSQNFHFDAASFFVCNGTLFDVVFEGVGDDFLEGEGLFFGCSLFFGFVESFVFTWHEGEFEVVESAFDVESESCRERAVGERDVVVE